MCRTQYIWSLRLLVLSTLIVCPLAVADEPITKSQLHFFETEVRPLLAEKCFGCHNAEKQKGDLRLDSLGHMLLGGESGASLVPGKPDESLLIEAVRYESFEMPPAGQLEDKQIAVLERWVAMGAPWPGSNPDAVLREPRELFSEEDRNWWAFQPVVKPAIPKTSGEGWGRNEIDHFVYAQLQSRGLTPAPEADRHALVRRLYFDIIGLPPTPEQVAAFVNDTAPEAYERLVDSLLDSKGYGEHAARQWLDLVRYADSDGYRADGFRPSAWRYRDYVIQSFNDDKPYDRFTQEQIAADEMFPHDVDARVALGYLRHWVYEWNIRDAPGQWKTIQEDLTDTTADVFMGLGLQCAKCHNHKFDPLLQKDYFRLQAFFAPIMPKEMTLASDQEIQTYEAELKIWESATQSIRDQIDKIEQPYRDKVMNQAIDRFPEDIQAIARKSPADRTPAEEPMVYLVDRQIQAEYDRLNNVIKAADKDRLVELRRQLKAHDTLKPKPLPTAMGATDNGAIAPPTVLPKRADEPIEPGFPTIMQESAAEIDHGSVVTTAPTTGRRTALALWLTDPSNPLSTRVITNRVWQSHFGRGLAENTSDFGKLGKPPTHPQLLDWMTATFVENGWSLKSLHRMILLSATYRQSTEHPDFDACHTIDPGNEYYWRRDTQRLQAEQVRDALLTVTGALKDRSGGGAVLGDSPYRSIFVRSMRNSPDELLSSFDLPMFFSSNSSRNTTTTAVQSLMMINSDRVLGHARKMASHLSATTSDVSAQIALAWQRVYGREPSVDERRQALAFIDAQTQQLQSKRNDRDEGKIETSKLPYRDGQAVRFMVDDPSLKLAVTHDDVMNVGDFTIETFFQLRSIANTGTVRTIVGKWDGDKGGPGWRFGVTGMGSRRKPQTLVLQMFGELGSGKYGEAAIFSDHHIEMNTPYYASASFQTAKDGKPGSVTFFLKDLSNDDEPLLPAVIEHNMAGNFSNKVPFTIGGVSGRNAQTFDGLVDDIRLVGRALDVDEILYTVERSVSDTIGHWQFELDPGVMQNSANDRLSISAQGDSIIALSASEAALVDFCHALLNSNEFLYVH